MEKQRRNMHAWFNVKKPWDTLNMITLMHSIHRASLGAIAMHENFNMKHLGTAYLEHCNPQIELETFD